MSGFSDAEWGKVVAALYAAWSSAPPLSPDVERFWRAMLGELPFADVAAAIVSLSRDGERFRPEVGQIHRRATDLRNAAPGWDEAWAEILAAVSRHGYITQASAIEWSDPRIRDTVLRIGWRDICDSRAGDPGFIGNVRRAYEAACQRHAERVRYAGIPGGERLPGLRQNAPERVTPRLKGAPETAS